MTFPRPRILTLAILASLGGLTACNSNNDDGSLAPTAPTLKTVTVAPSLGRISNARVVLRNAVNHQPIGDAPLNGSGRATFQVPSSVQAVIAEVVPLIGGPVPTYFDEGTGTNQPLPAGTNLRAAFTLANAVSEVGITALTEAAVRRAQFLAGGGADPVLTPAQIAQANALVNQAFGVANILQAPVLIGSNSDYNQLLNAANPAGRDYAMRLAALARQAHNALPAANSPAVAMMNAVASDLSDGKLDRAGAGFPASDVPYAADFALSWAAAVNALVTAVLGNIQGGLTQQQITELNSLFTALAQNLNFNPDPNAVVAPVTCASLQLPKTNAAALSEFVGNFTVDINGSSGKTGTATFSLAANGNVTLDAQMAHPTEICGPNAQSNGTSYLIITDRNELGKTARATVNLFKNNSSVLSVEGVSFAGAENTIYFGSKQGAVVSVPVAVSGFAPNSGIVGSTVTINGTGFDADLSHMVVKFSNNIAAEIVSSKTTELVVKVPVNAVTGPITVTNSTTGLSNNSTGNFTVQAGGGGGNTWTERTLPGAFVVNSITFGNGKFVVVGAAKGIFSSTDGISWTTENSGNANSPELRSVIYDGSQFITVGGTGLNQGLTSPLIATSPDGTSWTTRPWNVPVNLPETRLNDIMLSNGLLTAGGANGTIITSSDGGITWVSESQINNNTTFVSEFFGLAANGAIRVAVGRNSAFRGMIIRNDSTGWTPVASDMTDFLPRDVVWAGNQFVAVGSSDANFGASAVTMTSPDGVTWTRHAVANAPALNSFRSVFWDGSKLYGGGDNGQSNRMMMSSTDGISWTLEHQSTLNGQQGTVAGVAGSSSIIVGVGGVKSITKP
ncbi:MAG: IPT/TIG domain-containing protein [Fluviicoccus sp.]|uniref:IPT/TIG domain-containing protein n=1 Tax=Fluviicoccus sp. TaxID=2003552 RepID=UPI002726E0AD|nr:IPT/TIG domain-containing protein [Fluviicoccus sp.]MDO8329174.1 IPT/TIG domain-containing protein [Fluviicoccus sp.]